MRSSFEAESDVLAGMWVEAAVWCLFQKFFEVKLMEMPMALVRKRLHAPQRAPLSHLLLS